MLQAVPRLAAWLALACVTNVGAITVELFETIAPGDARASGQYTTVQAVALKYTYGGVDPIDDDCFGAKCIGLLTRDGSLDLESRYGCTQPDHRTSCSVEYGLSESFSIKTKIASVRIALHPDSASKLVVYADDEVVVDAWEGTPGSGEMEEIEGLKGISAASFRIEGAVEVGEYFAILETEIYVDVDEIETLGVSASTRATISATATIDAASAMNTVDGDTSDASSWSCSPGETCEITYDLEAVEALEQIRIAFSDATDDEGVLNVMAAGEDGVFFPVKAGIETGGRPSGSDGLQTFGGVRALARFVKIEALPASGGVITINEVEFRVGEETPSRPVAEKKWLKPTGTLPLGSDSSSSFYVNFDARPVSAGGCDSPTHFEGCHVYYVKDGDMDTRWSCGPLATGSTVSNLESCEIDFNLNYFRYVRQIQIGESLPSTFHMGDEKHHEFSIEANTAKEGFVTVVPSAISSGDTTGYQTFDLNVHTNRINLIPKFDNLHDWVGIKEVVILEKRPNAFVEGTLPVFTTREYFEDDDDDDTEVPEVEIPIRFKFDIPSASDKLQLWLPPSTVTALKMRFPANRKFTFKTGYGRGFADGESFTSAGGPKMWETFIFSEPATVFGSFRIEAVEGPTFADKPDYPTLRVIDFQVVGERNKSPGYFDMVSTTMTAWNLVPDIIGDGVSEQIEIMTAICETKGATFDGTDCVGELNDSTVQINMQMGDYFLDGPVFIKDGVTLTGGESDDAPGQTFLIQYEGSNSGNTDEDALIVIDGVTDAAVEYITFEQKSTPTGDIVPGTLGNICMDVRNSKDLRFETMYFDYARAGAARFVDSSNITSHNFWSGDYETGNFMELTRVDDFYVSGFPDMAGLRMDSCNDVVWEGTDFFEAPSPKLSPPTGGSQEAHVVITGDSSGIVIQSCDIAAGAEPRIVLESTEPLTLDNILDYEEAESGDCIVEVPTGTTEDIIIQVNFDQVLSKSGSCWVLQ